MKKKIIKLKRRLSLAIDSVNMDQVSTLVNKLISASEIEALKEESRAKMTAE